jgi:hypothetical protein
MFILWLVAVFLQLRLKRWLHIGGLRKSEGISIVLPKYHIGYS